MKYINLNKFKGAKSLATVSDEDFDSLSEFNWSLDANGYAIRFPGIKMHRVVMNAVHGQEVDHINGDRADNRRENLRICTRAQNQHNQRVRVGGLSRFKGVTYDKRSRKYLAQIVINKKRKHLKYTKTEEEAARIYDAAAIAAFGVYAKTNFQDVQCATV